METVSVDQLVDLVMDAGGRMEGNCVVCGKHLDIAAYRREEVCNAAGPEGSVVFCAKHLADCGTDKAKVQKLAEIVALAKFAQLDRQ
jgi:hypothetical protein